MSHMPITVPAPPLTRARALREAMDMTRLAVAARAGSSLEAVRMLELTGRASGRTIARVAAALGCSPAEIVGLAETSKPSRASRGK